MKCDRMARWWLIAAIIFWLCSIYTAIHIKHVGERPIDVSQTHLEICRLKSLTPGSYSCRTGQRIDTTLSVVPWSTMYRRCMHALSTVRWLDTVFQGQYLPLSLSINYVALEIWQIASTVVLNKDENLSWSGLQWHRSCHSNEMTSLPILLAAVSLGTGNRSSKIVHGNFFLQEPPQCSWSLREICKSIIEIFWDDAQKNG